MYSVIIPSIGRLQYLNELLQSINKQTLLPDEIIILLDNNNLCKKLSTSIKIKKNGKIIFCRNLNLSQKRNYGALIAKNKYLLFSDDDDIWELDKGSLTINSLKKYPVFCHEYTKFGYSDKKPKFLLGKKSKLISLRSLLFGSNIYGGGSNIAAWREIIIAIPFNKHYFSSEDYDWWIKILLADIKAAYLPVPLVKYRTHEDNMTKRIFKMYNFNSKIFNRLLLKSFILFLAFISGYLRSIISLKVKLLKKIFINIKYNLEKKK